MIVAQRIYEIVDIISECENPSWYNIFHTILDPSFFMNLLI